MKCLVTGASGHLGSYLVRHLLKKGADVHCLVRPASDLWRLSDIADKLSFIKADLAHIADAADLIGSAAPEVVFHVGWQGVTSRHRNDPEQITVNVKGGIEFFQMLPDTCRCFVGIGSQAEYGPCNEPFLEDSPLKSETAYGTAKLCLGLMIDKLAELRKMRTVWLRLFATYGPMDDERHLIPSVINQLLSSKRPALTTGEQNWDYLYIEDAAEAIYLAAIDKETQGFYNLCSGNAVPVRYIVETIRNLIDPGLELGFGDIPCRDKQALGLEGDCGKLQKVLGWKPATSIEEGLRKTVAWHREHREASNAG